MIKVAAVVFLALLIPVAASAQSPEKTVSGTGDASIFVDDVTIPDGTVMRPGQSFTKTWKIRNSGSTSWSGYNLAFVDGAPMGAPNSVSVPVTPPGATVDVSVPLTAPNDAGRHQGNWKMRTADGEFFGERVFVLILVGSSTERHGVVSGGRYGSPQNLFSVQVPRSSNWANVPFSMKETSVNQPNVGNYDVVAFEVNDFGEALIASVRRIPDDVLDKMKQDQHQKVLSNFAQKALHDWRGFPTDPRVVEETYLTTSYGESLLRVYMAEKGSLLRRATGGRRPTAADTFDTLIAVIVAKKENYYVHAIAENDAEGDGTDKNKEALKQRVRAFFSSVVLIR